MMDRLDLLPSSQSTSLVPSQTATDTPSSLSHSATTELTSADALLQRQIDYETKMTAITASTNEKLQQILDAMANSPSTALTVPLPNSPDTNTQMAIDQQTLLGKHLTADASSPSHNNISKRQDVKNTPPHNTTSRPMTDANMHQNP